MYRKYFKRILDLVISMIILPFWFIILLVVSLAIKLEDHGPVFYNAPRLGKSGKSFTMYKFRSMKVNAPDIRNEDGSTFNAENDLRLTKVGKLIRKSSIDETPQLINVLKGEMSFIGPRPDLPEHYFLYSEQDKRKLEIEPGITGYNQAYFRNSVPWKDRIINDIYYVDHITFLFDVRIFLRTIFVIIHRKGVFSYDE